MSLFSDTFIEMEHAEYKVFENASHFEACAVIRPAGCKPSIDFPLRIFTRPDSTGTCTTFIMYHVFKNLTLSIQKLQGQVQTT